MCKLNAYCPALDGNCECQNQVYQSDMAMAIPISAMMGYDQNMIEIVFKMLSQQNELIRSLAEQIKAVLYKISEFTNKSHIETIQGSSMLREEAVTPSSLLRFLSGDNPKFTHKLELGDEFSSPAYKERAFSVLVNIVDMDGNKVQLANNVKFTIMLYTADSPPKLLSINTTGDTIMRGTFEVEGNSVIFFKKIIVKEVTSHFINGSLYLVIASKWADYIKPLIIKDFVVKARKLNNDCPKKKPKIEDGLF
ncbi:hypothetical protein SteCoe_24365 [Stentor coeruleus]|uniref:Uncharacterized protein n=1 Tax=Stentor coeruleus TaxID=5963 RepID=A0A1R2BHM6_9CILI|nr:hypothetical protein SteCoe_24365 [Stentor coeruleus]